MGHFSTSRSRRRLRRFTTSAIIGLALVQGAAEAAPSRGVTLVPRINGTTAIGFNDPGWEPAGPTTIAPAELGALYQGLGVRYARFPLDWRVAEPTEGRINLASYKHVHDAMVAQGVRPLFSVMFAPKWAAKPLTQLMCNWAADCRTVPVGAKYAAWSRFMGEVARQLPQSIGIEVWNEPNSTSFWGSDSKPDPAVYARLVQSAYTGVKAVNPAMPVIAGSMANGGPGLVEPGAWLSGMLKAGAGPYMDAVSVHPYPGNAAVGTPGNGFDKTMSSVRGALAANGFAKGSMRLWLTEIGASTATGGFSESDQAAALSAIKTAVAASPDVDIAVYHTMVDPCTAAANWECMYGIVRRTRDAAGKFIAKPAYTALHQ